MFPINLQRLGRIVIAVVALGITLLSLVGCAQEAVLLGVDAQPRVITPNADGDTDATRISYSLRRPALVSIYLQDEAGQKHYFRQDVRRSPGDYQVDFGGVVAGRCLPDGVYTLAVEARPTDGDGPTALAEVELSIEEADTDYPQIIGLTAFPPVFTPDRDGLGDRVRITYDLTKQVTRVSLYLEGADGQRYFVPEDKIREFGAAGRHEHDYDGGIDLGAVPPPAGTYRVVLQVEDAVGNKAEAETELVVEEGGVPRATIVKSGTGMGVEWSATAVPLGEVLYFTLTVQNISSVPIRTQGPEPGTIYDNNQNYNTLGYHVSSGAFRIGVNYEGNSAGDPYPYRWQLGASSELTKVNYNGQDHYYLMPGQTVTVHGGIRMVEPTPRRQPHFWVGLIHEDVEYVPGEDYVNPTAITIGY
ncbi:MAG: hypothetical protein ACOYEW_04305 [Anaerolineae bacterium]|jgi:hypothetical protein